MFDDDEEGTFAIGSDSLDDFEEYAQYIKALEEDYVEKGLIIQELMDEFDLEKREALKIYKRYKEEWADEDDDYDDDIVEDDDYGDGNSEN